MKRKGTRSRLTGMQRFACTGTYVLGRPTKDLANEAKVSPAAIRMRRSRGLKKVGRRLAKSLRDRPKTVHRYSLRPDGT